MKRRRWGRRGFVFSEVVLFLAIPVLAYGGFRTLLDTRTGTFVDDPGPDSPGWVALVDPSPLVGVVEMDAGTITGLAVVVSVGQTARGGAVILVPAELEIETGLPLSSMTPEDAVAAVGAELRLRIPSVEVVDTQRWELLLRGSTYSLSNPDPVPGEDGEVLFGVGEVEVSGTGASAFLGRTIDGTDSLAALVRRELFWTELLQNPPTGTDDPLGRTIGSVAGGPHEVVRLPLERGENGAPVTGVGESERLVRRVVAFPAGDQVGSRFRIRLEDRTGTADLDAVARSLGRLGLEVVAISNGAVFDDAPTAVRVEAGFDQADALDEVFGGVSVETSPSALPGDPIVLQLGPDHEAVIASWS